MYIIIKLKITLIFYGLFKHEGTSPIAPDGMMLQKDAACLVIVFFTLQRLSFHLTKAQYHWHHCLMEHL